MGTSCSQIASILLAGQVRSRSTPPVLKLPKEVLADERHEALSLLLASTLAPLWAAGRYRVSSVAMNEGLAKELRAAASGGVAHQGLELAADTLRREQKGLDAAQRKEGAQAHAPRVSRLLLLANDGSERFYRDAEMLLVRHPDRLMIVRLDIGGEALGEALFRTAKLVRCVLVTDKSAVSRSLLALVHGA